MKFEIFEGPESGPMNLMVWGAIICAVIGIPVGFSHGGIGGAIAGILIGAISGFFIAGFVFIAIVATLFLLPWILIIGGLGLIIFLIQYFWGLGKP